MACERSARRFRAAMQASLVGAFSARLRPLLEHEAFAARQAMRAARWPKPESNLSGSASAESFVDDLGTCRGVVISRAATILRSIETQPLTGRFVLFRRTIFD